MKDNISYGPYNNFDEFNEKKKEFNIEKLQLRNVDSFEKIRE